jgi:hypothetical protein
MRNLIAARYRRLLLGGLLLRLVLMPFFMHSDILDQYWRSHFVSHHGVLNLPELMISRYGFPSAPLLLTDALHGVWLFLVRPLLPEIHRLFLDTPEAMVILTDVAGHQRAVLHFLGAGPAVLWALFLFKLPYLLLDFVALGLLLDLVPAEARRRVAAFWMFNFVSLFTLYIWGRYDVLTSVLVLLALGRASAGRPLRSGLLLGLATITKYWPVFVLAPWLLCFGTGVRDRLRAAAVYLAVPAALGLLGLALSFGQAGESILNVGYQIKNVVRISFDVGDVYWNEPHFLYPFVVLYALLVLHDLYSARQGLEDFIGSALACLMLYYALSALSPQYFFWHLPLLALCLHRRSDLVPLHLAQVLLFVGGLLELGTDLVNTAAPLFPQLVAAPLQPRYSEKLSHIYPVIVGLFRSLFTASCLWMAYLIWARNALPPPSLASDPSGREERERTQAARQQG